MQKLTVCIAALVGLMCGVADCSSAIAKTMDAAQVRVLGEGRAAPKVSQGGRGVPLRHALEQIVPPDFSINLPNAGPWADVPVSWPAHVTFVAALRDALSAAPDVNADVDLKLRLVTVRANASVSAMSDDAAFAMKHVWGLPPNGSAQAPQPSQPSQVQPAQQAPQSQPSQPPAQSAGIGPALATQPPLLAAMHDQPTVAPATKRPAATADLGPAATASPAPAKPAAPSASTNATVNARNVVGTTTEASPASPATVSSTDAVGEPLPAAPPPEPVREWHLSLADHTVKTALTRWAKEDGWQLVWDVPLDFGVDADATVTGTFEQALQAVVDALKKSETPIQAILYRGNKVLRIVAKGAA
ncbi:toxin co-regulated pilus biosynthesis Q family protein [Trinickia sp.]|uniref:toxin co-regulated pilus biosynthesis Q family protein n=1 Tax=Trinickia sp. TaxID=2571163 RepID=UPI003F7F2C09